MAHLDQDSVHEAEKHFGITLRRRTSEKYVGACPVCGGDDRFVVWVWEKFGWCSRCGKKDYYGSNEERGKILENAALKKEEKRKRAAEIRAQMSSNTDWIEYHTAAMSSTEAKALWAIEGMDSKNISKWGLGYTNSCPVVPEYPSLTMPVYLFGELVDIRHKLLGAENGDGKYRSHLPGAMPPPFSFDAVLTKPSQVIVVEGEKKTIILNDNAPGLLVVVGLPGVFVGDELIDLLLEVYRQPQEIQNLDLVTFFDPGAFDSAEKFALKAIKRGFNSTRIVDSVMKPDDMVLDYGIAPLLEFIRQARRL